MDTSGIWLAAVIRDIIDWIVQRAGAALLSCLLCSACGARRAGAV